MVILSSFIKENVKKTDNLHVKWLQSTHSKDKKAKV